MLKAIIFDFDGVIVDSEPIHFEAYLEVLKPLGISFNYDQYLEHFIAYDDRDGFRAAFNLFNRPELIEQIPHFIEQKSVIFDRLASNGVATIPGIDSLVRAAAKKMPIAIGSGALGDEIQMISQAIGLRDQFQFIVSADDVAKSKPHPETYTKAVQQLADLYPEKEIKAEDCLIIEDSAQGVQAAIAAGTMTLAITTNMAHEDLTHAQRVISTFEDITIDDIIKWYD